jgi:hypothetical protein
MRVRPLSVLVVGIAALAPVERAAAASPRPLRIFVRTVEKPVTLADGIVAGSLPEAVSELRKQLTGRRKWFEIVETEKDAEISVGIGLYGVEKVAKRGVLTVGADNTGRPTTREHFDLIEKHHVRAEFFLPLPGTGRRETIKQGDGRSLSEAAEDLANKLEEECRLNYSKFTRQY